VHLPYSQLPLLLPALMLSVSQPVGRLEMSSGTGSDSDEFFDAKESWMSPPPSQTRKDDTLVHRFVC